MDDCKQCDEYEADVEKLIAQQEDARVAAEDAQDDLKVRLAEAMGYDSWTYNRMSCDEAVTEACERLEAARDD